LVGVKFPRLRLPILKDMVITYDAGYTTSTIPKGLKTAIMAYVAEIYEHRGDEQNTTPVFKVSAAMCKPFVMYSAWG